MKRIDRLDVSYHDRRVGQLSLTPDNRLCVFEYDRHWLAEGFSISPFDLPLRGGLFTAKAEPFYGNFGIFEDSLPDGYGRYMLHKALLAEGVNDSELSALERLSLVGERGMGALTYAPSRTINYRGDVTDDFDMLQRTALEVLAEKQDKDAGMLLYNSGNSGGARPKAVFADDSGHWLVKFRHIYDPHDMGRQEYRYNELARSLGIDVPDFRLVNDRYFASRRFDIKPDGTRIHTATAGAILSLSLATPYLDYSNLLALTGFLTHSPGDVEQMFRRMVFNYLVGNKDDHCKNFSFYVDDRNGEYVWRLAPAYDLTLCTEGYNGQHATSVNGTGEPRLSDFIVVGVKARLSEARCRAVIDEMMTLPADLLHVKILP